MIVFDLDGTLALIEHRRHLVERVDPDWDAFFAACVDDIPNEPIVDLFDDLPTLSGVEIWSGRSEAVRAETELWLQKHTSFCPQFHTLKMRPVGDYTPDEELKRQWLIETRERGGNITLVFDDRDKVVKMWREEGIVCAQVAPGAF